MTPTLHPRLDRLPFSPIRKMFNAAASLDDVCNLSIGQPDFPTPEHIQEAFIQAVREGKTRYELDAGVPALREALARSYSERTGCPLKAENVLVTTGCCQALYMTMTSLVLPGKEMLTPDPAFIISRVAEMGGGHIRRFMTNAAEGYQFDAEAFVGEMRDPVCAVLLNSPGNPTGTIYPRATMEAVVRASAERRIPLISDEVYDRMILDEGTFTSALECEPDLDQLFVCSSFSKTYAMAGLRIGWIISSEANIREMQRLHMFISTTENSPSQWAGLAALEGPQSCVDEMVSAYRRRRDMLCDRFEACSVLKSYRPSGAFFIMPSLPEGTDCDDLTWRMLHETGVCTVPGSAFGEGCRNAFRISFAASDAVLEEALNRMIPWLEKQSY